MAAVKRRIQIDPAPLAAATLTGAPVHAVTVVKELPGTVTAWDRLKSYYHTVIVAVGVLLGVLTQVLPVIPESAKPWVTTAVAVLTALSVALKSNEQWVDGAAPGPHGG